MLADMFAERAKKQRNIVTKIIELNVLFIIEIITGSTLEDEEFSEDSIVVNINLPGMVLFKAVINN